MDAEAAAPESRGEQPTAGHRDRSTTVPAELRGEHDVTGAQVGRDGRAHSRHGDRARVVDRERPSSRDPGARASYAHAEHVAVGAVHRSGLEPKWCEHEERSAHTVPSEVRMRRPSAVTGNTCRYRW
jgi:hypothetical protein